MDGARERKVGAKRRDWRGIAFRIAAGVTGLLYLSALQFALAPWVTVSDSGIQNPEIHRWHYAVTGAVTGILLAGTILAMLWRPRTKPLLLQYAAVAVVVGVLIVAPFVGPSMFFVAVPVALVVAAYPTPRRLFDFSLARPVSRPLLGLTLVVMVLLLPNLWYLFSSQLQGAGGELATANQWISSFEHIVLLLLAGIAASTKRPGWRTLGFLTGVVFIYLGVAALAVPDLAGSWGTIGGVLAFLGGAGYIALTLLETRRAA